MRLRRRLQLRIFFTNCNVDETYDYNCHCCYYDLHDYEDDATDCEYYCYGIYNLRHTRVTLYTYANLYNYT